VLPSPRVASARGPGWPTTAPAPSAAAGPSSRTKVAIVHDYLTQRGGAERVVLSLHRTFPEAPIFTSVYAPERTFPEFRTADVRVSYLQHLPLSRRAFRAYLPLYPSAFESLSLRGFDAVISSSSGWAHGVKTGTAFHVCYCHTPARWLYDQTAYLEQGGPLPQLTSGPLRSRLSGRALSVALAPVLTWLESRDRRVASEVDLYIANSSVVQARIRERYGRRATVIHPPVALGSDALVPLPEEGFYLVVARLLPYKRVDLAIRACNRKGARLVVAGEGPARPALERLAGPTVTFVGRASDQQLRDLYVGSRALLQCGSEDFGIAPLEANAAGRPVVALGAGGAVETVVDGETGILFAEQTESSVLEALDRLEAASWDPKDLRSHAERFGEARFAEQICRALEGGIGVSRL
jgi:glycosyltransferase involved in cell wall biosynthesis